MPQRRNILEVHYIFSNDVFVDVSNRRRRHDSLLSERSRSRSESKLESKSKAAKFGDAEWKGKVTEDATRRFVRRVQLPFSQVFTTFVTLRVECFHLYILQMRVFYKCVYKPLLILLHLCIAARFQHFHSRHSVSCYECWSPIELNTFTGTNTARQCAD